jgi:2-octaprenyl-6-methoxyphenol hydroxylase
MRTAHRQAVVISGGGIPGLSLALAIRQALGRGLDIILADPGLTRPTEEGRAYAISAASARMLEALGIWDIIKDRAQPITRMEITDSRTRDPVRQAFLTFNEQQEPGNHLGHMIESTALVQALRAACTKAAIDLRPLSVKQATVVDQGIAVRFGDGSVKIATLVVAAEGARSKLREQAGLGWVGRSYGQSGIVATIGHERPHEGKAVQHFLPAGPFAILPLVPENGINRSSIVWTEASANVEPLLALDNADLLIEIERRFGLQSGELTVLSRPAAWPLAFGIARRFAGERLVLLGDAAHVIHPLAGQGLNLGLKDAAVLSELIVEAGRLGLDIGSASVLSVYEQQRRPDTLLMGTMMDGLNRLFSNDLTPVRLVRDLGLGLVDRLPGLKDFFARRAAGSGVSDDAPKLLRGESL